MKNKITIILFLCIFSSCTQTVKTTFPDGKIMEEFEVNKAKEKHGVYKRYHENGVLAEETHFVNAVEEGERKLFFKNGNIESVIPHKNGSVDGTKMVYYETGELLLEAPYSNNLINGIFKKYYKNGNILEEVTFVDDYENGPFKEYYENGKLKWKGQYLNGDNEFGIIENYNIKGDLVKKMMCDSMKICKTIWTIENGDISE